MKDSGIDWIGKIPDEWKIEKGKRIFAQRNERGNKINLELLSPTQKYGVIPQTLYEELTTYSAVKLKEGTDLSQLKTVHKGDYCISLRSFQGGFEYSKYEGVVSPAYQIFDALLDKYSESGIEEIEDMKILTVEPLKNFGTPAEIVRTFGGKQNFLAALKELEDEIYSAA